MAFLKEAAEMLATLQSRVEREVYGNRMAELLKIFSEGMQVEIKRAASKKSKEQKRQLEQLSRPINTFKPKERSIR